MTAAQESCGDRRHEIPGNGARQLTLLFTSDRYKALRRGLRALLTGGAL